MRWGILGSVALAALILGGCAQTAAVSHDDPLVKSTVDASSVPGFVAEKQVADDVIPAEEATAFHVDPASTRFQGDWDGREIYLAVMGTTTVSIVSHSLTDSDDWGSGSSMGNTVIGTGDPLSLQYLPQGTAQVPNGWRSLSDWIIVRD